MMSLPEPPTIESLPEPPVMVLLPAVGVDEVVVVVERDVVAIGRADVLVELALEGHLIVVGVDELRLA